MRDRGSTLRLADDLAAFVRWVEPAAHKAVLPHAADDTRHRRVRHLQKPFDLLLRRLPAIAGQIAQHAALRQRQPLLREIGILTADGKLKNDMIRKYNQIDHYVELVAPMFEQDDSDEIVLLDCACGKSYLSFVMNYYIHEVLHRRCRVIGVDIKEHVIDESRAMAKRLGYHNMTFICADLRTYQPPKNVTAVISLHACDIATDLALGTAIRAKAKYIACVPCCHKELLDQYTMPGLEPLTKFGVFKARFNDVLTDSMRALKLEAEGYKVSVVEYISPLDTPKNLLIRATRTGKVNHRAKAEYDAVRRTLGTTSELDRRCAELDNEFFVTDEDLMG